MCDVFCHISARGNIYDNPVGSKDTGQVGSWYEVNQPFDLAPITTAPYAYRLEAAATVPGTVTACAGPP